MTARARRITVQSVQSIHRSLGRSVGTAIGVAVGVAVFIATLGWAATVNATINTDFDATLATRITAESNVALAVNPLYREDFDAVVGSLPGVVHAGIYSPAAHPVTLSRVGGGSAGGYQLVTATPGALRAAGTTLAIGRFYDEATISSGQAQVLLSPVAARELGLAGTTASLPMAIEIDGAPVTVLGVVETIGSQPEFGFGVLAPPELMATLGSDLSPDQPWTAVVRTELGAAEVVGQALPFAINPAQVDSIGVQIPPSPDDLRGSVQMSLNNLVLGAGALSVFVGGIGIMNAMLSAVRQRSNEIGLRRALGARARDIAFQFVVEGTVLGAIGGALGAVVAAVALVALGFFNGVAPVAQHWWFAVAPGAGAAVGMLAALYPSTRAARLNPAETLRR